MGPFEINLGVITMIQESLEDTSQKVTTLGSLMGSIRVSYHLSLSKTVAVNFEMNMSSEISMKFNANLYGLDYVIFQSLSDTISSNIFQINSNGELNVSA